MKMRTAFVTATLLGLSAALVGCEKHITDRDIKLVTLTELQTLVDQQNAADSSRGRVLLLIDPRSPRAFGEGHIPSAQNVQLTAVPVDRGVDPARAAYSHIVVYGDDPASAPARAMTKRMIGEGYEQVRMFMGGLKEWRGAGLPVRTAADLPAQPPVVR